jgi:hypothetical protein
VTRKERQRVPARGSAVTTAKATIQASIIELFAMGLDCLANDNMTKCVGGGGAGFLCGWLGTDWLIGWLNGIY